MSNFDYMLSIDSIQMNIAIFEPTDDGDFIFVAFNKMAETTDKISRDEVIGNKVTKIFPAVKEVGIFDVFMRVHKTSKEETHDICLYKDDHISGWRKNRVFKLDNGYIMVIYKDVDECAKRFEEELNIKTEELNYQHGILSSVLNATSDLIFYKDYLNYDGKYIGCNKAFEHFVGRSHKEIVSSTDIELFGKEVGDFVRSRDREILQTREIIINEEWVSYPDGHRVLLSTSKTPFYDNNGNLLGIFGISRDITQIYKNNAEMLKLKERMDLAFLGSHSGYWEWDMWDNTAYYSLQWSKMLGYNEDEKLPSLLSTWGDRVHPDDIETVMLDVGKTIDAKREHIETIHRLKHKNGNWVWIIGRGIIEYNSAGKAISMVGIHTDITEQKAIQLKSTHQAHIIEQFHDSVISTDMDGNIVSWNLGSKKLFGYSADEVIGKHISLLYTQEDRETSQGYKKTLMRTGNYSGDAYRVTKSKEIISVAISLSFLKNEHGVPVNIVGYTYDISERKRAEDEIKYLNNNLQNEVYKQLEILREKDKQLLQQSKLAQMGDMVGMIAHQWRQPLNAISATGINLSLLSSMDMLKREKVKESSEFIQEQCQKMSSTIDTFMNFVKPAKEAKEFKISHALGDVMSIMKTQLNNHNIEVTVNISDNYISIVGYEDLLEQVIINILSNARDAFENMQSSTASHNKFIDIKIDMQDNIPIILIKDNAGGIPIQLREKIFNPYFTTKEQGKGTGIGLYMSMDIMKKSFNGDLKYRARKDGSCFEIICGKRD